jgi:mRNA interferase MazF
MRAEVGAPQRAEALRIALARHGDGLAGARGREDRMYPEHTRGSLRRDGTSAATHRPAVIIQTDALPAEHASVVVCQMTSELSEAPECRVTIEPTESNGLRAQSQVMADKPVTIRRERIGRQVGRLNEQDIARVNVALAFVMGLAD